MFIIRALEICHQLTDTDVFLKPSLCVAPDSIRESGVKDMVSVLGKSSPIGSKEALQGDIHNLCECVSG